MDTHLKTPVRITAIQMFKESKEINKGNPNLFKEQIAILVSEFTAATRRTPEKVTNMVEIYLTNDCKRVILDYSASIGQQQKVTYGGNLLIEDSEKVTNMVETYLTSGFKRVILAYSASIGQQQKVTCGGNLLVEDSEKVTCMVGTFSFELQR